MSLKKNKCNHADGDGPTRGETKCRFLFLSLVGHVVY